MSSNKSKCPPASSKKRGGARRDAGPPAKVPRSLPENKLETIEDIQIEHRNIRNWLMKGQLSERIAGTAIHNLEALAKILMPSEIEAALNELRNQATDAKRDLEYLKGLAGSEGKPPPTAESGTSGSSTVDDTEQAP